MDPENNLLERQVVTTSAGELVSRVAAGGSGALFMVGDAGLGKTSLIDQGRVGWPLLPTWRSGWAGVIRWRPPCRSA